MSRRKQIIRQYVSDELFTDREEFLDYFYEAARKASTRRIRSTVLLGRRRMGKTEIFTRVVNRLFFEQDPTDPLSVVPVYYSFEDTSLDLKKFAVEYLENFARHYVAFYLQQPKIIETIVSGKNLIALLADAKSTHPYPESLNRISYWLDQIEKDQVQTPERLALQTPGRIADLDESGIAVFLDEFQNIRMPHQNFDVLGFMQNAVESPYGPHFVTGSAMSILVREIIGVGPLYGRFDADHIEPLSEYWGAELSKKTAAYYGAEMNELMAPVIADRCGGNPFYISAVIQQAAKRRQSLVDEESINGMLAIDISSGLIWSELSSQVSGWIHRINNQQITKWILYLSALEEGECISLERIQTELQKQAGKCVELDKIRDVLIFLSQGELVDSLLSGDSFRKVDDPVLSEFLRVWGDELKLSRKIRRMSTINRM